jgi:hypothetical protein
VVLYKQDYEQYPQTDRELLMVHCFYCACTLAVHKATALPADLQVLSGGFLRRPKWPQW